MRVSLKDLESLVLRINEATSNPIEPYTKQKDEKYKTNIGNYHLSGAYGGWQLQRMHNKSGGVSTPLGGGFNTKREMYDKLYSFYLGLNEGTR